MTQPATAPATTTTPTPAAEPSVFSPDVIAEVFGPQDAPANPANDVAKSAHEPAKADEKKPLDAPAEGPKDKVSDRITAALRAEKRAEQQRVELAAKKRELDDREAQLKPTAEDIRLFEEDPAAFVAKKGWNKQQVASFLDKLAGNVQPEAVADKKLTEQERRIADLEAKLAAEEASKKTVAQRAHEEAAGKAFVQHIAGASEKYPYLVKEFTESEAVTVAFEALSQVIGRTPEGKPVTRLQAFIAQHGEGPSDEVIAEHINSIAQQRIEHRAKASWGKAGEVPAKPGQGAPIGDQSSAPQVTGASPRTLSRADQGSRAAAPRTKGNVWTHEDQAAADEESMRILAAAGRKF